MTFENAVLRSLATLDHPDMWQRGDGLMTESLVMKTYPQWFPRLRLWLLEKQGLIESRPWRSALRSHSGLRSYRLAALTPDKKD